MYRHRRDHVITLLNNEYQFQCIDDNFNNLSYYNPLVDDLTDITNGSIDSAHSILYDTTSSISFTDGYLTLPTIDLTYNFTIQGFFRLGTDVNPLFTIGDLSLTYIVSTGKFVISKYVDTDYTCTKELFITLTNDNWYLITLIRNYPNLYLYVGLSLQPYEVNFSLSGYPIISGDSYIGKVGSNTYTGNIANIRISNGILYPLSINTTDSIKHVLYPATIENTAQYYKLIHLVDQEYINNSLIYPVTKTYSQLNKYWDIAPASASVTLINAVSGLAIIAPLNATYNKSYTIECSFQVENDDNNVIIFADWQNTGEQYYYLYLSKTNNKLYFRCYVDDVVTTYTLGDYKPNMINYVAIQISEDELEFYVNGEYIDTYSVSIRKPLFPRYTFNVNVSGNTNNTTSLYLYEFLITNQIKYTRSYLPHTTITTSNTAFYNQTRWNYHDSYDEYTYLPKLHYTFTLSGSTTINLDTETTYTITQPYRDEQVAYNILLIQILYDELDVNPIVLSDSALNVLKGANQATFDITVPSYAVNPYAKRFLLVVSSRDTIQTLTISVNDTREYSISDIVANGSFVEGYLAKESTVSGTIPSLSTLNTATTTANLVNIPIYGNVYRLETTSDVITFPTEIDIKTVMFIYQELDSVVSRSYVGDDNSYTFNGGLLGQLVGSRIVLENEYAPVLSYGGYSSIVKISQNDSLLVAVNDVTDTVLLFEKDSNGIWQLEPIELDIDVQDPHDLQGASIDISDDGTKLAIGMKNANLGEGVVQVWVKSGSTWVKDLHLGSPLPIQYASGFGLSVAISNDGTKLFVGESGSQTVYCFEKATLWDPDPVESWIGTDYFGYSIACNADGTLLVISSPAANSNVGLVSIYRNDSGWSLEDTLDFGVIVDLQKTTEYLVLSNYNEKTVKLYHYTSSWSLDKTFTSTETNFGYAISISNNNTVLISSPQEDRVYLYLESTSWDLDYTFQSSIDDYGYTISHNDVSVVISDYSTITDLYTTNATSFPQNIVAVRQYKHNANIDDNLFTGDVNILSFVSNIPLSVNRVGDSKINTGLNGYFLGVLLFDDVLDEDTLTIYEDKLARYLSINEYAIKP